jgi:hypothetical protein
MGAAGAGTAGVRPGIAARVAAVVGAGAAALVYAAATLGGRASDHEPNCQGWHEEQVKKIIAMCQTESHSRTSLSRIQNSHDHKIGNPAPQDTSKLVPNLAAGHSKKQ